MNSDLVIERIKKATGAKNQGDIASVLGISRERISEAKRKKHIPSEWFIKLYETHKINMSWLLDEIGPMYALYQKESPAPAPITITAEPSPVLEPATIDTSVAAPQWHNQDQSIFCYIPLAESRLASDTGTFVFSDNKEDYYAVRRDWVSRVATNQNNLIMIRVSGESMHPTIQDDDTLLLDTARKHIRDGYIYALRIDDTIMVKRLSLKIGGKVEVISDNREEYRPYEVPIPEVAILGQVIFLCRDLIKHR